MELTGRCEFNRRGGEWEGQSRMGKQDRDARRAPAGIRSLAHDERRCIGDTGFDGTDRLGTDVTQVQQHRQSGDKAGMHGDFTARVERDLAWLDERKEACG